MKREDIARIKKGYKYCGLCQTWIKPKLGHCPNCFPERTVKSYRGVILG